MGNDVLSLENLLLAKPPWRQQGRKIGKELFACWLCAMPLYKDLCSSHPGSEWSDLAGCVPEQGECGSRWQRPGSQVHFALLLFL